MPRLINSQNAGKKLKDAIFGWRNDFMCSRVMFDGVEYALLVHIGSSYSLTAPALCMEDIIDENESLPIYDLTWEPDRSAALNWDPVPAALFCDWKHPVSVTKTEATFDLNRLERSDFEERWRETRAGGELID